MPKRARQAGQNIRELALKRRVKAIIFFIEAGIVILTPLLLVKIFNNFLKQITYKYLYQPQTLLNIPLAVYLILIAVSLGLVAKGASLWIRANNADQGAKGEEETSKELSKLEDEGWEIEYGMRLGNKLGDADIVCSSPQYKTYVIDVKSHKGEVVVDNEKLCRRRGNVNYPFEKDFINQVMKQALQLRKQKDLRFVTPILVFSNATVSVPSNKFCKVYVVEKSKLASLLKSLG